MSNFLKQMYPGDSFLTYYQSPEYDFAAKIRKGGLYYRVQNNRPDRDGFEQYSFERVDETKDSNGPRRLRYL